MIPKCCEVCRRQNVAYIWRRHDVLHVCPDCFDFLRAVDTEGINYPNESRRLEPVQVVRLICTTTTCRDWQWIEAKAQEYGVNNVTIYRLLKDRRHWGWLKRMLTNHLQAAWNK